MVAFDAVFSRFIARLSTIEQANHSLAALAIATGMIAMAAAPAALAEEGPGIRQVFMQHSEPARRSAPVYVPQPTYQAIPQIFRPRDVRPQNALNYAPISISAPRYLPSSREPSVFRGLPSVPRNDDNALKPLERRATAKAVAVNAWKEGEGNPHAVNYCVRLCDGYAFPIGNGDGNAGAQEAACQLACPAAQTALYSLPAGAKDIDEAIRAGHPYSALPNAFRYRTKYDAACTCRGKGETQSTAALLTDFTMRRGDLAMTRIGMRYFVGSSQFPYRASAFPDALARLTDKKDIAQVRAMEAASLRGIMPKQTHASVRNRVVAEVRAAERRAADTRLAAVERLPRGFVEMRAKQQMAPSAVKVVKRKTSLVAMN